jgi:hypothetical protein
MHPDRFSDPDSSGIPQSSIQRAKYFEFKTPPSPTRSSLQVREIAEGTVAKTGLFHEDSNPFNQGLVSGFGLLAKDIE